MNSKEAREVSINFFVNQALKNINYEASKGRLGALYIIPNIELINEVMLKLKKLNYNVFISSKHKRWLIISW